MFAHERELALERVGRVPDGREQQVEEGLLPRPEPRLLGELFARGADDRQVARVFEHRRVGDERADGRVGRVLVPEPEEDQLLQHRLAVAHALLARLEVLLRLPRAAVDRRGRERLEEVEQGAVELFAQLRGEPLLQRPQGMRGDLGLVGRDDRVKDLVQKAHRIDLRRLDLRAPGRTPLAVQELGEDLAARQRGEDDVAALGEEGVVESDLVAGRLLHVEVAARGVERYVERRERAQANAKAKPVFHCGQTSFCEADLHGPCAKEELWI